MNQQIADMLGITEKGSDQRTPFSYSLMNRYTNNLRLLNQSID